MNKIGIKKPVPMDCASVFTYKSMNVLTFAVFISIQLINVSSLDCYYSTECKYKYFSSKTPYENVRGDIRDTIIKESGCEPISVWAMMRHGKRNPGVKFAKNIKDILILKDSIIDSYENGNSLLCAQDVDNLNSWEVDQDMLEKPNKITTEGHLELLRLARRMKEALPELLNELQNEDTLFAPGFGKRLQESAKSFVEGLGNNNLEIREAENNYSIAAPYASCGKFRTEHFNNPNIYQQVEAYLKTPDALNMKERVERKLGLNVTLLFKDVIAMYDVCRYCWDGIGQKPNPWCAVFSTEDLKVQEYIGDLEHYYRNGYGTAEYSNLFGKIALADMLRNFEQTKNGEGKKLVSYFTHASMLDMMLVALDLNKDATPLLGAHRDLNRKWRTTFISTFGANMIAVLNRCQKESQKEYDHKIAFYCNEVPLLELCNQGVCSWEEFETIFKPFLNVTTDFCEYKWTIIDE